MATRIKAGMAVEGEKTERAGKTGAEERTEEDAKTGAQETIGQPEKTGAEEKTREPERIKATTRIRKNRCRHPRNETGADRPGSSRPAWTGFRGDKRTA